MPSGAIDFIQKLQGIMCVHPDCLTICVGQFHWVTLPTTSNNNDHIITINIAWNNTDNGYEPSGLIRP